MEKNLGWSRGKAKVGIDALDNIRSIDIDRHSITGENILLPSLFFFVTFSPSFLLFFFLPDSDFLVRRTKTQQHCCSRSKDERNIVASVPLASLNFLASRSLDPQIDTLPKENFALPWTSAGFKNIEAAFFPWRRGLNITPWHYFSRWNIKWCRSTCLLLCLLLRQNQVDIVSENFPTLFLWFRKHQH